MYIKYLSIWKRKTQQFLISLLHLLSPSLEPNWSTKHTTIQLKITASFTTSTRPLRCCITAIKSYSHHTISLSLPWDLLVFLHPFAKPTLQISSLASNLQNSRVWSPFSEASAVMHDGHRPTPRHRFPVDWWFTKPMPHISLRCVKPKKPTSIFSLTRLHVWSEVLSSTYTPSKNAVDCVASIPKNPYLLLALLSQKKFAFASIFEFTNC